LEGLVKQVSFAPEVERERGVIDDEIDESTENDGLF